MNFVEDPKNPYHNFYKPDTPGGDGDPGGFCQPQRRHPNQEHLRFPEPRLPAKPEPPGPDRRWKYLREGRECRDHHTRPDHSCDRHHRVASAGSIDAITSGNITLSEESGFGPMRIDTVMSTVGDIALTVPDTPNPGDDLVIVPGGQITAPGGIQAPSYTAPQVAPTVIPTGGNTPAVNPSGSGPATVSGYLAAGTYYVVYTFTYPNGSETLSSPASIPFTVAAGDIPQVTLPLPPVGATGYKIYLSNSSATPGSATIYSSVGTVSTFNLLNACPRAGPRRRGPIPLSAHPRLPRSSPPPRRAHPGGALSPGTYFVFYTVVGGSGSQSPPSPSSAAFVVSRGNIPSVTLPPLPVGGLSYDLYLSDATAQSGTGVLFASGITTTTVILTTDPPNGGVALPVDNVATVAPIVTFESETTVPVCPSCLTPGGMSSGFGEMAGLAPGSYFVEYTFTYVSGAETFVSPSTYFTVTTNEIAIVTLPQLPPARSGINLYLSAPNGGVDTATRYYTGVITGPVNDTFPLSFPAPVGGAAPPVYDEDPVTPRVNVTGGNAYGGQLLPGTYYLLLHIRLCKRRTINDQPGVGDICRGGGEHPPGFVANPAPRRNELRHLPLRPRGQPGLGDPVCLGCDDDNLRPRRMHSRTLSSRPHSTSRQWHRRSPPRGVGHPEARWRLALISSLTRS